LQVYWAMGRRPLIIPYVDRHHVGHTLNYCLIVYCRKLCNSISIAGNFIDWFSFDTFGRPHAITNVFALTPLWSTVILAGLLMLTLSKLIDNMALVGDCHTTYMETNCWSWTSSLLQFMRCVCNKTFLTCSSGSYRWLETAWYKTVARTLEICAVSKLCRNLLTLDWSIIWRSAGYKVRD